MSLANKEHYKLFKKSLRDDESILWIGEPKRNWRLQKNDLPLLLLAIVILALVVSPALLYSYFTHAPFVGYILSVGLSLITPFAWIPYLLIFLAFEKDYFAITNQRVLIYEHGKVTGHSLLLLADAIKHKPKNGASNITLYSATSQTGKMPAPVATLNNLPEWLAEHVYDLLRETREERLVERVAVVEHEAKEALELKANARR